MGTPQAQPLPPCPTSAHSPSIMPLNKTASRWVLDNINLSGFLCDWNSLLIAEEHRNSNKELLLCLQRALSTSETAVAFSPRCAISHAACKTSGARPRFWLSSAAGRRSGRHWRRLWDASDGVVRSVGASVRRTVHAAGPSPPAEVPPTVVRPTSATSRSPTQACALCTVSPTPVI